MSKEKHIEITEERLFDILKETINGVLREGEDKKALYHQVFFKDASSIEEILDILNDILTYGLRVNSSVEADGIWFSNGNYFYGKPGGIQLALRLDCDEYTAKRLFDIDHYAFENNASVMVARKDIPISALKVVYAPLFIYETPEGKRGLICGGKDTYELVINRFAKHSKNNFYPIQKSIDAVLNS